MLELAGLLERPEACWLISLPVSVTQTCTQGVDVRLWRDGMVPVILHREAKQTGQTRQQLEFDCQSPIKLIHWLIDFFLMQDVVLFQCLPKPVCVCAVVKVFVSFRQKHNMVRVGESMVT